MHQRDLLGIGFIQGGVIDNHYATCPLKEQFGLLPQRCGVRFEPVEQPIQRIVGRGLWAVWLHTRALRA
jgi:hypothetical protein